MKLHLVDPIRHHSVPANSRSKNVRISQCLNIWLCEIRLTRAA